MYERRKIPTFPNYEVDNEGNVFGVNGKKLTPIIKNGYAFMRLRRNGKQTGTGVHRLVALAFVDGYAEGLDINHKDKNRLNNRPENLEWTTHKHNVRYSIARKLEVTTKSGVKLYYESCGDFSLDTGISTSNLARWYIQKHDGFIKKFNLYVRYIDDIV